MKTMKTVTAPKAVENTITGRIDLTKVARGHQAVRGGVIADRRTGRNRSRGDKNRNAFKDW